MKNFHLSFELYPPRQDANIDKLLATTQRLSSFNPDFYSITFGAGGDGSQKTTALTTALCQRKYPIAPHMICMNENELSIQGKLKTYRELCIKHLVLIRGDVKSTGSQQAFPYAAKLVEFVKKQLPDITIYVSCYPEIHPETSSLQHELDVLKSKIDAGATKALTQLFFNADAYGYYLDACQKQNINIPVIPGIMGIKNPKGLLQFCQKCQAELPRWLRFRLDSYQDATSQAAFIEDFLTFFCEKLIQLGAPGFHMYTLNHLEPCQTILNRLNLTNHEAQTNFSI